MYRSIQHFASLTLFFSPFYRASLDSVLKHPRSLIDLHVLYHYCRRTQTTRVPFLVHVYPPIGRAFPDSVPFELSKNERRMRAYTLYTYVIFEALLLYLVA